MTARLVPIPRASLVVAMVVVVAVMEVVAVAVTVAVANVPVQEGTIRNLTTQLLSRATDRQNRKMVPPR